MPLIDAKIGLGLVLVAWTVWLCIVFSRVMVWAQSLQSHDKPPVDDFG